MLLGAWRPELLSWVFSFLALGYQNVVAFGVISLYHGTPRAIWHVALEISVFHSANVHLLAYLPLALCSWLWLLQKPLPYSIFGKYALWETLCSYIKRMHCQSAQWIDNKYCILSILHKEYFVLWLLLLPTYWWASSKSQMFWLSEGTLGSPQENQQWLIFTGILLSILLIRDGNLEETKLSSTKAFTPDWS